MLTSASWWGVCSCGGCLVLGGVYSQGGLLRGCLVLGGVCSWGVVCSRGGCLLRGGSQHALRQTPSPPLWTESQTPVKTLPWPSFVAAGKNLHCATPGAHTGGYSVCIRPSCVLENETYSMSHSLEMTY